MPRVETARAGSIVIRPPKERTFAFAGAVTSVATALVVLAGSLALMLLPLWIHFALDVSGSAATLGLPPAEVHALSDRTVAELVFGPGTFALAGPDGVPFFSAAEASHLRDARSVLWGFLALAAVGAVCVAVRLSRAGRRPAAWAQIRRGAAGLVIGLVIAGVVALAAFEPAFELFHRVFFPGGNWAFDPRTDRLVQLYPFGFWQLTTVAMGTVSIGLATLVWSVARRRSAQLSDAEAGR